MAAGLGVVAVLAIGALIAVIVAGGDDDSPTVTAGEVDDPAAPQTGIDSEGGDDPTGSDAGTGSGDADTDTNGDADTNDADTGTDTAGSGSAGVPMSTDSFGGTALDGNQVMIDFYRENVGTSDVNGLLADFLDVFPTFDHPDDAFVYSWYASYDRTYGTSRATVNLLTDLSQAEVTEFYEASMGDLGIDLTTTNSGNDDGVDFEVQVYGDSYEKIDLGEYSALEVTVASGVAEGDDLTSVEIEIEATAKNPDVELTGLVTELGTYYPVPGNYELSSLLGRAQVNRFSGTDLSFGYEATHDRDRGLSEEDLAIEVQAVMDLYNQVDTWNESYRSDDGLQVSNEHGEDRSVTLSLSGFTFSDDTSMSSRFNSYQPLEDVIDEDLIDEGGA